MPRKFNTAGICRPAYDYMLPPLRRLAGMAPLIDEQAYFVLHAPRQSGKSTALVAMAQALLREGRYVAAVVSMETGASYGDDVALAEQAVLSDWRQALQDQLPPALMPPPWPAYEPGAGIGNALSLWCRAAPRPVVLFVDEIDALPDLTLLAVLRQLRSGFNRRPGSFPWSLVLCGVRDVRDYKLAAAEDGRSHGASPFNIKTESLTLRSFTGAEVAELYQQHTDETGQIFLPDGVARAVELTAGQPWLVNALARQVTHGDASTRSQPITAALFDRAKDALILRRDTHIDSLAEKLHEPRVRRILEAVLVGAALPMDIMNDDLAYVRDLGLVAPDAPVRIANPIYAEVIPRTLSYLMQESLEQRASWYLRDDQTLDMVLLLAAFQEFFAAHSEAWLRRFAYQEAGPHLLLMAFLQRVVNGGGRITREFAVGAGRADLIVEYAGRRAVLELKLRRGPESEAQGVAQLAGYLDRLGEEEGHLLIFDRRSTPSWAQKIFIKEAAGPGGQRIYVFGA